MLGSLQRLFRQKAAALGDLQEIGREHHHLVHILTENQFGLRSDCSSASHNGFLSVKQFAGTRADTLHDNLLIHRHLRQERHSSQTASVVGPLAF